MTDMKNNRTAAVLLSVLVALGLTACGNSPAPDSTKEDIPSSPRALDLTPFCQLNAGEQVPDSHADSWTNSRLVPEHFTEGTVYKNFTTVDELYYPRITRAKDGTYVLTFHSGGTTVNGYTVYFMTSPDLKTWTKAKPLFVDRSVTTSQDKTDTRAYTNGYPLTLSNGDILAIASFRVLNAYSKDYSQQDNGIAMRRSTDNGATWGTEEIIYRGTNWEGQILELADGTIQVYFSESRPWISGSHSGTGMIWSTDGGKTWQPDCVNDRIGDPYTVAREMYINYSNAKTLFTYQMPGIIVLNDGSYAGIFETRKDKVEPFYISFAWSDAPWTELLDETPSYPTVTANVCGPSDRKSWCWAGTAPTLVQFPSGETVAAYHSSYGGSNHLLFRMGDSKARNFSSTVNPGTEHKGSWGQVSLHGSHEMIAVNRDSHDDNNTGCSYRIFALDHDISATRRTPAVDGRNRDWAASDEALFLGREQDAYATLRCSADKDNIYFLIEVIDEDVAQGDFIELYLAPAGAETLSESCIYVKADWSGLLGAGCYNGAWPVESAFSPGEGTTDEVIGVRAIGGYEGTLDDDSDVDGGCLVEIKLPRDILPLGDGSILVDYSLTKAHGKKDALSNILKPNTWLTINNL